MNKIDQLAQAWREAKYDEEQANAERLEVEAKIVELMGLREGDEGTLSNKTEFFKVTATGKLNRTLDKENLEAALSALPEFYRKRVIKWEPKLDIREFRKMGEEEPEAYKSFAPIVVTKPAKAAVKVEVL